MANGMLAQAQFPYSCSPAILNNFVIDAANALLRT